MISAKTLSVAFVMDSITTITPAKDSSVAMMRAGTKMNVQSFYMGIDDLFVEAGRAQAITYPLTLTDDPEVWYSLGHAERRDLSGFDAVVMRKDPPVDKRFIHACHMLEHAVRDGARVYNNPSSLIGLNEKLFALEFPELCPETVVASDLGVLRRFLETHKKIILKPLDAMGGTGVFMVTDQDVNFEVIWELQTLRGTYPVIAQKFIPEITEGDKRVVVINGEAFEHVLVRTPKEGSIRGNMAAGGTVHVRKITPVERAICDAVGPALRQHGILFAGLDIIGDKLIEINITSPTGLVQISKACGVDVAERVMKAMLEAKK